ncbi:MAG TPA: sugar ABC transporter substrate-binding protein [Xanthobacteraceae bacterium]|nr:sugar ABC transporter substrate-binding protein [Xanthobacteraceae bacterium]
MRSGRGVRGTLACLASASALAAFLQAPPSIAQQQPEGLTRPVTLAPFDRQAPSCAVPPGLQRTLAFAQDNEREFMRGVARGLEHAARARNLAFRVAVAGNDSRKMIEQVQQFRAERAGAVIAAPVNSVSLARSLQELIWDGAYVGTVVPPPAVTILNAPQYLTGKVLAEAAAAYIKDRLKGKANVVLLTHDSLQFLSPRFAAMRDVLQDLPGVNIVADISPLTVNKEGGKAMMETVLLAHPQVDVVLGADTVVLGALEALRAAGKARDDQFLGGIDGEPEAVAEIKAGGPYKASVSLASTIFGYALGQFGADWLEGKSVPQAMDILPSLLTRAQIAQYEADFADPAAVFADPQRRDAYLKMYGNICYDTRERYLNFPWSSERK